MSRDSFFVPGAGCLRGRVCLRGLNCLRVRVCLRGMGLSPGMSHAAASICKSGLEIENRCTDCPCFDLFAASIRKSGLEIGNRCTDCPCFDLFATSILKSGLEFKNHCSAIVPASRIARLQQYLPQRCRVRFQFFFVAKYCSSACVRPLPQSLMVPPAALSSS